MLALITLRREGVPLLCSEVARWNDITPGAARRALHKLRDEGMVEQNDNNYWVLLNDGQEAHE